LKAISDASGPGLVQLANDTLDVKVNSAASYRRLVDYCVPGSNCDPGFPFRSTPKAGVGSSAKWEP